MNKKSIEIDSLKEFNFSPDWDEEKKYISGFANKPKSKKTNSRKKKEVRRGNPQNYFLSFSINQKVSLSLKNKLRDTGITWSIDDLVDEIISQRAFDIKVTLREKDDTFKRVVHNSIVYKEKDEAIDAIIYDEKGIVTLSQKEIKKINSDFDHVLIYEKKNDIFPPKSSSYLSQIVDAYLIKNNIRIRKDKFIDDLTKTSDEECLGRIKSVIVYENTFHLNNLQFQSLDSLIFEISENKHSKYLENIKNTRFSAKEWKCNYNNLRLSNVDLDKNNTYLKRDLINSLTIMFKKSNFQKIVSEKKKYVYSCNYIKQDLNLLNTTCKKILKNCSKLETPTIQSILGLSDTLSISKSTILQEIKWVVKSGLIRQFNSGKVEVIRRNRN